MQITQTKKRFLKSSWNIQTFVGSIFSIICISKFYSRWHFKIFQLLPPWKWELNSEIDKNNSLLQHFEGFSTILTSFRYPSVIASELQQFYNVTIFSIIIYPILTWITNWTQKLKRQRIMGEATWKSELSRSVISIVYVYFFTFLWITLTLWIVEIYLKNNRSFYLKPIL